MRATKSAMASATGRPERRTTRAPVSAPAGEMDRMPLFTFAPSNSTSSSRVASPTSPSTVPERSGSSLARAEMRRAISSRLALLGTTATAP